jgi:hypothetical protein
MRDTQDPARRRGTRNVRSYAAPCTIAGAANHSILRGDLQVITGGILRRVTPRAPARPAKTGWNREVLYQWQTQPAAELRASPLSTACASLSSNLPQSVLLSPHALSRLLSSVFRQGPGLSCRRPASGASAPSGLNWKLFLTHATRRAVWCSNRHMTALHPRHSAGPPEYSPSANCSPALAPLINRSCPCCQ